MSNEQCARDRAQRWALRWSMPEGKAYGREWQGVVWLAVYQTLLKQPGTSEEDLFWIADRAIREERRRDRTHVRASEPDVESLHAAPECSVELMDTIESVLSGVTEKHREVVRHYLAGMSVQQIAGKTKKCKSEVYRILCVCVPRVGRSLKGDF